MQEYQHEELVSTKSGKSMQELMEQINVSSTHAVIGVLPSRGELVKINGLVFVVLSKSDNKGRLHLEIVNPKKGV